MTPEHQRLREAKDGKAAWKRWGPYLAERAWGTVREDYSPDGNAWGYFPHDHARSRAYRWNEDGLGGICDAKQHLCFALALWNERDPILKERLFGLTGPEGNHGEDVKEAYFYLDSTPTHSSMKFLYKYPQQAFPYGELVEKARLMDKRHTEYELVDTGVFAEDRYFDIVVEYAKAGPEDILIRIEATNRGPAAAPLEVFPTLWFRNSWTWETEHPRPSIVKAGGKDVVLMASQEGFGPWWLACEGAPELLFTDNETNLERLYGVPNKYRYLKDGIDSYVVHGDKGAVNSERGSKACARYKFILAPGETTVMKLRLTDRPPEASIGADFDKQVAKRRHEADSFYDVVIPKEIDADARLVARQAFAGMLWSKQFFHYNVQRWLEGDSGQPPPHPGRKKGRNAAWTHLDNSDIISMPDKWEYPWYAAWDLAFHCIPLAHVDVDFAKDQLILMLREWYMHPNGQIPAYEWAFGDVNPPVHAWAALKLYELERSRTGKGDREFLEKIFHKLLLNFTWWVNRKDTEGNNVFEGGFLGLDNIGVFDRSAKLPTGGHLEQSDGTSWMCMYTLNMLAIAMELAADNHAYEDVATKFIEHFVYIAEAMNDLGPDDIQLWDEAEGFYYDVLKLPDGNHHFLEVRSMVGLIPLYAVHILEEGVLARLPGFRERLEWFMRQRPDLLDNCGWTDKPGAGERRLMALVSPERLKRVLAYMLDEEEFLSPYGVRSLSRYHRDHPFRLNVEGVEHRVDYDPAESTTGMFGGNSNWRGPVWMPVNYMLVESLRHYHEFLGCDFKVECPTRSGRFLDLGQVADELAGRLSRLFLVNGKGHRPFYGTEGAFLGDPALVLFYEYFHGDTGKGLGASHQTGWTGLVADLLVHTAPRRHVEVPCDGLAAQPLRH